MHICLLRLSMILFTCHLVSPREVTEGFLCLFPCASYLIYLSASDWPSTFIDKSDSDMVTLLLSVITIITILVKLMQLFWGYVTSFGMFQFVCLFFLYLRKVCIHIIMVLSHTPRLRGTWSSSRFGQLVKKKRGGWKKWNLRVSLNLRGALRYRGNWNLKHVKIKLHTVSVQLVKLLSYCWVWSACPLTLRFWFWVIDIEM